MRLVLSILGGLLAALVAALLLVPFLVSTDGIRRTIESVVAANTGFQVRFDGPVSISTIPRLALVAENVTVDGAGAGSSLRAAEIGTARVALAILPLLSGRYEFAQLQLDDLDVIWITDAAPPDTAASAAAAPATETASESDPLAIARQVHLDRVRISDGSIRLVSEQTGAEQLIAGLQLDASLPSLGRTAHLSTTFSLDGRSLGIDGTLNSPEALLSENPAEFAATLSAPDDLVGPLTVDATVVLARDTVAFRTLRLSGETFDLGGSIEADWAGQRPRVRAELAGSTLDIDGVLKRRPDAPQAAGGSSTDIGPSTAPLTPRQTRDVDFSVLDALDLDLSLSLDRFVAEGFTVAPMVATGSISGGNGELIADLIGFAGGQISAAIAIDRGGADPLVTGRLNANQIDAGLAAAMANLPYTVTGEAGAAIDFATAGTSVDGLRQRLNAAGSVFLSKATLAGLGLSAALEDPAADRLEAVGLVAEFSSLTAPIVLAGGATWRGERFTLDGTVDGAALAAGAPAATDLRLSSAPINLGYSGAIEPASSAAGGRISIETPSLRGLLAWLNRPLAPGGGLEAMAFAGGLDFGGGKISVSDATLTLDDTSGRGLGSVTLGPVPQIAAQLAFDRLDLTPYLGAGAEAAPVDNASAAAPGSGSAAPVAAAPANDAPADRQWSNAPLDLSGLAAVNADIAITAAALQIEAIRAGPLATTIRLQDGALDVDVTDLQLYGGYGRGRVQLAGTPTPALSLSADLNSVAMRPFLNDVADFDRIEAIGNLTVNVTGAGASQRAIVQGLNGNVAVALGEGVIRGVDLSGLVQALTTAVLSGWQVNPDDQTQFTTLDAAFTITNGVATATALALDGRSIKVDGTGTVNLVEKGLDLTVDPRLKAGITSTSGQVQLLGLGVPVRVVGPWERPQFYPDIQGILTNPEAAFRQLQTFGGGILQLTRDGKGLALDKPTEILEGPAAAIGDQIEGVTGVPVGDAVRSITGGTRGGTNAVLDGVGRLLGSEPAEAPSAAQPQATDPGAPIQLTPPPGEPTEQSEELTDEEILRNTGQNILRGLFGNN